MAVVCFIGGPWHGRTRWYMRTPAQIQAVTFRLAKRKPYETVKETTYVPVGYQDTEGIEFYSLE